MCWWPLPCWSPLPTPHWEPTHWSGVMTHPAGGWVCARLAFWLFGLNLMCSCQHGLEHWNVTWNPLERLSKNVFVVASWSTLFIHSQWCRFTWWKKCTVHIVCIFHLIRLNLRLSLCSVCVKKINAYELMKAFFSFHFAVLWYFSSGGHSCSAVLFNK